MSRIACASPPSSSMPSPRLELGFDALLAFTLWDEAIAVYKENAQLAVLRLARFPSESSCLSSRGRERGTRCASIASFTLVQRQSEE